MLNYREFSRWIAIVRIDRENTKGNWHERPGLLGVNYYYGVPGPRLMTIALPGPDPVFMPDLPALDIDPVIRYLCRAPTR